jgi:hypothetical protein
MPTESSVFASGMADAFDAKLPFTQYGFAVRAGPITVGFNFSSAAMSASYGRSVTPEPSGTPDLTIRVLTVDDLDLGRMIPAPFKQGRTFSQGRYFCLWHPDERSILYLLDRSLGRGLIWLAAGEVPEWELSRPACPLIHAFLADTDWSTVHGAAVGRDGRMLLLAGPGRIGKSTAALSCALAGWDYAGDDYVLADTSAGWIEPLYSSARLRVDMAPAFSDILRTSHTLSREGGDQRHELRLADHLDPALLRGGRLVAILLPRRAGAQSPQFEPARRSDAFHALFKNTMLGAPGSLREIATKLSSLVARAPAFFVDTGSDPKAIPSAFDNFISSH